MVTAGLARASSTLRSRPIPAAWTVTTGRLLGGDRQLDQRQLLRHARRVQDRRSSSTSSIPVKRFLGELPWLGVVAGLGARRLRAWRACGSRCSASCCRLFIAVTGQWEKATITVYLCGISVVIACLIGVPIAVWASTRDAGLAGRPGDHRHAADAAELRLSDAGGDAVPGRRFHRHGRRRRLFARAGRSATPATASARSTRS